MRLPIFVYCGENETMQGICWEGRKQKRVNELHSRLPTTPSCGSGSIHEFCINSYLSESQSGLLSASSKMELREDRASPSLIDQASSWHDKSEIGFLVTPQAPQSVFPHKTYLLPRLRTQHMPP